MAAGRADTSDRGYYLYGIVRSKPRLEDVPGVDGTSPVFVVEEDGVGAIVSEVPLAEFGDTVLQQKLEELPWLEQKVRAHERVLEQAAQEAPVLPLRFGTVYLSLDPVRNLLTERREQLVSTLEELRGKREWGVKCVVDRERLLEAIRESDEGVAELATEAESKPAGAAYFARKRLERGLDAQAKELAARLAAEAHERLTAVADRAVRDDGALLKGAYLVDRTREQAFRDVLQEAGAAYERYGVRFELTGPWPPYSFVGGETE
jgi:Gas vesicle synthesis protein GvpL/GvpF